jgi:hypothetical protein
MNILVEQNKNIDDKSIITNDQYKDKSVWEELKAFWKELCDLLYIDMKNAYLFITENKNYFICTVILAFLLQFTNVSNLGTSFERYCRKELNIKQSGGAGAIASVAGASGISEISKGAAYRSLKEGKRAEAAQMKQTAKDLAEDATSDKDKYAKSKKISKKEFTKDMKLKKQQEEESKTNQKRISFFENIKNKLGKGGDWGGQYGILGPVFGNMEKIMDSVKTIFYIITILLTIAGILSIPVLIFLVITYMIIKYILGKYVIIL